MQHTAEAVIERHLPPIDLVVPEAVETATFALG